MWFLKRNRSKDRGSSASLRATFRRVERREWRLWIAAFAITLLVTLGLASFLLNAREDGFSFQRIPEVVRGLIGLVFLFDIYTVYQQMQIHRIRRRLIEREELFHLINENAADMIAVVDIEGHRLYNSLSYHRVLGYSPDELQSSAPLDQVHPDDRERVKQATAQAQRSGVGQTLEYRFRHKNGNWLILESSSSVIRNSKGEPEKLVIVNRDITARKKAEEALRRSEADFRSVVENAPYGIYRASMSGQLLQVNPALQKMLGYDSADELHRQDLAANLFQHAGEYQRLMELLARTNDIKDLEMDWKRKDGDPITVRCSGRRIQGENGTPGYLEVFAEDVTEKRALERQLRMAQKMEAIGRLSGGIAHDFNNLLGVIIGYSRVLRKAIGSDPTLSEHASEIEKAGQRAASLTRQLLAFSRQQVLSPVVLDLNALVSDMAKMLPRLLGEDVEVSFVLDDGLEKLKADQSQVEQIIMNLAVNARDAMPSGGTLEIRTANVHFDRFYTRAHPGSKIGDYVALIVTDTGTGMDPETLAHIFEPFFTTKEQGKGTGLGLATVYGVVKQSNGYIWVDSALGQGSSFQIYLPRYEGEATETSQKTAPTEKLGGSEHILLVEDADPLRKLIKTFLEGAGFEVVAAQSGGQALALAAAHPKNFDLLITDVVMPGMNGRVLAEQLTNRYPGLPVLYISGYTDSFTSGHNVLEQGTHLLHKPFTEEVLIAKVREVLDASRTAAKPAPETKDLAPSKAN